MENYFLSSAACIPTSSLKNTSYVILTELTRISSQKFGIHHKETNKQKFLYFVQP